MAAGKSSGRIRKDENRYASLFKLDWVIMSILILCLMAALLYGMISLMERQCLKRRKK
ncbi:MAG: hypothetical protein ACI4EG_12470 [Fusicatenibacter sp.]|nr:hypothetical protein [Fusicatenibacter sp.]